MIKLNYYKLLECRAFIVKYGWVFLLFLFSNIYAADFDGKKIFISDTAKISGIEHIYIGSNVVDNQIEVEADNFYSKENKQLLKQLQTEKTEQDKPVNRRVRTKNSFQESIQNGTNTLFAFFSSGYNLAAVAPSSKIKRDKKLLHNNLIFNTLSEISKYKTTVLTTGKTLGRDAFNCLCLTRGFLSSFAAHAPPRL